MPEPVSTTVLIGGRIAGRLSNLFGPRERSACRTVAPGDVSSFRQGRLAAWVPEERRWDINKAFLGDSFRSVGVGKNWGRSVSGQGPGDALTTEQLADLHMNSFVPLCLGLEVGATARNDPNHDAHYNTVRAMWRDNVRSGNVAITGGQGRTLTGGDDAPNRAGGVRTPSLGAGIPLSAGFGGSGGIVLLAAAGLLAVFLLSRGGGS